MTLDEFIKVLSFVLPLAAIAGAAYVYLRQSADEAQKKTDRETIEGLEKRVEVVNGLMEDQERQHKNDIRDLEQRHLAELKQRDHQIDTLTGQIEHVQRQNTTLARQVAVLQGVVTQAAEIAHLQTTLDTHHAEATGHWRSLLDKIDEIKGSMT